MSFFLTAVKSTRKFVSPLSSFSSKFYQSRFNNATIEIPRLINYFQHQRFPAGEPTHLRSGISENWGKAMAYSMYALTASCVLIGAKKMYQHSFVFKK